MRSKNLLVVSNSYPTKDNSFIGNIFVREQINHLKKYFNDIYVISPLAFGMDRIRRTKFFNYQEDNVHVYFPKYFNIPMFWYYGRSIWCTLELNSIINCIELNALNFDLIHAHFTWPSGAVAVKLKEKYSVPLIITEHTSNTFSNAIEKRDKIFTHTWNNADLIIRVRKGDVYKFEQLGIPLQKVVSIPNGYDKTYYHSKNLIDCRGVLGLPINKKVILNVGNMYDEVKGHKFLIQAMSEVVKTRNDVLCVFVGEGKLRKQLEKQIHDLNLDKYCITVGKRNHKEIPIWINACNIFVLPSLNEGNPTVMFEALGCGKPFIGTKVGGVPEIITSEDYGLLVQPANPKDLAEKILMALDREWDSKKILDHASQFTWENIGKQIIDIYEQVLEAGNLK